MEEKNDPLFLLKARLRAERAAVDAFWEEVEKIYQENPGLAEHINFGLKTSISTEKL
jgi:hypothetical protein